MKLSWIEKYMDYDMQPWNVAGEDSTEYSVRAGCDLFAIYRIFSREPLREDLKILVLTQLYLHEIWYTETRNTRQLLWGSHPRQAARKPG